MILATPKGAMAIGWRSNTKKFSWSSGDRNVSDRLRLLIVIGLRSRSVVNYRRKVGQQPSFIFEHYFGGRRFELNSVSRAPSAWNNSQKHAKENSAPTKTPMGVHKKGT